MEVSVRAALYCVPFQGHGHAGVLSVSSEAVAVGGGGGGRESIRCATERGLIEEDTVPSSRVVLSHSQSVTKVGNVLEVDNVNPLRNNIIE